ncbi:GATA type transcriptional activator of nitrogen-regulated proteins [Basidiobolus ranarum]|uniref:GATA type transcriptional activator of nitrogen-regulated proteins n=1 Tax=Basidiobolus ranarum TaxID=34480 RepID=A0ABR2W4B9_9FUNG
MAITAVTTEPTSSSNNQEREENGEEGNSPAPSCARSVSPSKPAKAKKPVDTGGVSATVCANCGTTTTPLWRRAPNGDTICNACGLYMKARKAVRPHWLKRNAAKKTPCTSEESGTCPGDGHCNGTGGSKSCSGCPAFNQHQINRQSLVCANCGTTTTPLWRRDEAGATICNACGLYHKLHGRHRPVSMKRSIIKRRKRMANGSIHADDRDISEDDVSEDEKSVSESSHGRELVKSSSSSPKKVHIEEQSVASNNDHDNHNNHHDHDPNSCNHDLCRQNVMKAGYVPALEDYGKPMSKRPPERKRMSNKISSHEGECKPKRKQRRFTEPQVASGQKITPTDTVGTSKSNTTLHSDSEVSPSSVDLRAEPHFASHPEKSPTPLPPQTNREVFSKSPHSSAHATPPMSFSSPSPSLVLPIRDSNSSSPRVTASSAPLQHPARSNNHNFTLPPIYEQRPHLPPISMGTISSPMNYQGYSHPSTHVPVNQQPNPQPVSTEYCANAPNPHPAYQSPSPHLLPTHEVQGSSNITKQDLEVHRMELQREVSHLSMLLSKTTAILAGLDQAVTSKDSFRSEAHLSYPSAHGPTTTGPPAYWDGRASEYQPMAQPNPNYRSYNYHPGSHGISYNPVHTTPNVGEYPRAEYPRYPEASTPYQPQYDTSHYRGHPQPYPPPQEQRPQPPYPYPNSQLPVLYQPPPPPPSSSDSLNQPPQTIR